MEAKTIKKLTNNIVTTILYIVLIVMLFVVISSKASGGEPQAFGYQLKTVLSGSMEPGIKTGSIIAVKPGGDMARFKKGDVITFKSEDNQIVTHRVVRVINNGDQISYQTKGDNNKTEDLNPVISNNVIAEYSGFTIPYLGYFADFTKSKTGSALILLLPGLVLLAYAGFSIWKTVSQFESKGINTTEIESTDKSI